MSTKKRKHGKYICLGIFLLLVCTFLWMLLSSAYCLTVTNYTLPMEGLTQPLRLVHLSDLHGSSFGEDNSRLIRKIGEQVPDLILITGDLINYNEEDITPVTQLLERLCNIAPVYVSLGNHEIEYAERNSADIEEAYRAAGAHVLEFSWEDMEIKGNAFRLGGFYGYGLPETDEACRPHDAQFQTALQDTDLPVILLTHMPLSWYRCGGLDYWDFDLVLTGHSHGGQIRIPFVGGLYAPDMGWFPGREEGVYISVSGAKTMILSRGLGNTESIPRFNNIPEIVVVDLVPLGSDVP